MAKYKTNYFVWALASVVITTSLGCWDIFEGRVKGEARPIVRLFHTIRGDDVHVDEAGNVWVAPLEARIVPPLIFLIVYFLFSIPTGWMIQALWSVARQAKQPQLVQN